jgi:hypothetical protein
MKVYFIPKIYLFFFWNYCPVFGNSIIFEHVFLWFYLYYFLCVHMDILTVYIFYYLFLADSNLNFLPRINFLFLHKQPQFTVSCNFPCASTTLKNKNKWMTSNKRFGDFLILRGSVNSLSTHIPKLSPNSERVYIVPCAMNSVLKPVYRSLSPQINHINPQISFGKVWFSRFKSEIHLSELNLNSEYWDGGHEQLISNGGRFKPGFCQRR